MKLSSLVLFSAVGVAVAQSPSPTMMATDAPTESPAVASSDPPTATTVVDTDSPTGTPTGTPSATPSGSSTGTPTASPSMNSTEAVDPPEESMAPTSAPKKATDAPTAMPVATNGTDSSAAPTDPVAVTDAPSASATASPTVANATDVPAPADTDAPAGNSTSAPKMPTASPTESESAVPSGAPTTPAPTPSPTVSAQPSISSMPTMPKECSAHPACAGLANDCCPTVDDIFLYCCFEPDVTEDYSKDITLIDPSDDTEEMATYFISTSTYFNPATAPNGDFPVINYVRDPNEVYDLVYFKTAAIANAGEFVSGTKKLYIDLYTEAPPCTQIILQFDNLEVSNPTNYPVGRHSRYLATTTVQGEWERLEFDFLDRPDGVIGDDRIDSIAMFFSPGLKRADSFFFRNLDVGVQGCTSDCETPSPKSCAALFDGESGACSDGIDNDNDGLIDCEDSECTLDEACAELVTVAYASALENFNGERTLGSGSAPMMVTAALACTFVSMLSLALF